MGGIWRVAYPSPPHGPRSTITLIAASLWTTVHNRGLTMTRLILSITTIALAYTFSPASAPAQAAAESVLLNANSAAATAKAGTALGSALNRATKQLAGQVQEVTHPAL